MGERAAYLDAVTVLRRAKSGDTYHRATCPRIKVNRTVPWSWAEGKTRAEVEASHANGLKPCKVCDPLTALPGEVS